MMNNLKGSWKEHENFIAFIVLTFVIAGLVLYSSSISPVSVNDVVTQAKIRILDSSIAGLLTILGMGAQALFRTSQADKDLAAAAKATAEKVPPLTGEAKDNTDEVSSRTL